MEQKQYTPMIQQYLKVKEKHQDTIVMYRLGDFYEMFFEDAKIASNLLDLILTARGKNENAIPMCGVPHHAVTGYIQKLVNHGHKVAIVEQLEEAVAGKIVERDVVKIITPGTICSDEDVKQANYLLSIYDTSYSFMLLYLDHYSGEMFVKEIQRDTNILANELHTNIKEVLVYPNFKYTSLFKNISYSVVTQHIDISQYNYLNPIHDVAVMKVFELMMQYLLYTQKTSIQHLQPVYKLEEDSYLQMDSSTKNNLELLQSTKSRKYSLWGFLDRCITSMGSRKLQQWIEYPLVSKNKIEYRLNIVEKLKENIFIQNEIKQQLKNVFDVKRLFSKVAYETISPKELQKLHITLKALPTILQTFYPINDYQNINMCSEIVEQLDKALLEEVATYIKDGNVFQDEYHEMLKHYRKLQNAGNQYILDLEQKEKEKTGIKNLKIGYNRAFGYYIEISKGQVENVKEEFGYIRKQTLTTGERYISLELKTIEDQLLSAKENAIQLEIQLYKKLLDFIKQFKNQLMQIAEVLAEIDVYYALSVVSSQFGYVKPVFDTTIDLQSSRHPIVETLLTYQQFISNDFHMQESQLMILTGPNMGGKSTYMRQVALISIMAQIGCFVPAKYAKLKIFKKIFTRMGASDDILSAQSTFMVEMSEANYALRNANQDSLILFDEIGRGTSTYDGMSLAWAMIEYIQSHLQATTIFSTHYHELTQLEKLDNVKNYHVEVLEENDHVTFLYKVKPGYVDKSYGINVAKLAKLPHEVIERSRDVLNQLHRKQPEIKESSLPIQKESKIELLLQQANVDQMTPLEALLFVAKLKEEL